MKFYTDTSLITPERRVYLADILRPYFNKRTPQQNMTIYGSNIALHQVVESLPKADLGILPLSWNYYQQRGETDLALRFVEQVQRASKPAVIWVNGDLSLQPPIEDAWLFMQGGYQSTRRKRQFAMPVIIGDPLPYMGLPVIQSRDKQQEPTVGFCGQADDSFFILAGKILQLGWHNLKRLLDLSPFEKQPLLPPTLMRSQALDFLEKSPYVQTKFIRRKQYRAGAKSPQQVETVRKEFFSNILESDYTLCLRGKGNFSARLYETLAMGRLPLFINTDSILPYDHIINWKNFMIWVDQKEIKKIPQILLEFHMNLNGDDFHKLQAQARQLWSKSLTFDALLGNFESHFW